MKKLFLVLSLISFSVTAQAPPTTCVSNLFRLVQNLSPTGEGDLVMVLTGTIPVNIPCDMTQTLTTHGAIYARVSRNTPGIVYLDNNRPPTVWAICS